MKTLFYSCIVCRRDELADLPQRRPDADFVCFTDEPERNTARGWRTAPLAYRHHCAILTARWHKLQPHVHSPGYDLYVWLDGHIAPREGATLLIDEMRTSDAAAFRHRRRRDPYQEARFLKERGITSTASCEQAIRLLQADRYPENGGLHETGILLMKMTSALSRMLDEWWTTLERSGGTRDQLHFDRLVRKHDLALHEPAGESRVNEFFDWTIHRRASPETRDLQDAWRPDAGL